MIDGCVRRQVADAAVVFLATVCLAALDRLSTSDPKHGVRLKLENLAFLDDWLQSNARSPLSQRSGGTGIVMNALQSHVRSGREGALNIYLKQQLENAKLLQMDAFAEVRWGVCWAVCQGWARGVGRILQARLSSQSCIVRGQGGGGDRV